MTDDELVELLMRDCERCAYDGMANCHAECRKGAKLWLAAEYKEDEGDE